MSADAPEMEPSGEESDLGPFGARPRMRRTTARLAEALSRTEASEHLHPLLAPLTDPISLFLNFGRPEVLDRGAGTKRPGVIAQLAWPRLGTRLGIGLELPPAHAIADRLLGYDRAFGGERLQATPVEWGIFAFVFARTLARLAEEPGPLGPWDLILDRVGPEPFVAEGLGPIITVRWPLCVGSTLGSVRLWVPASLASHWLLARPPVPPQLEPSALIGQLGEVESCWVAEVGTITMRQGLSVLRTGLVRTLDHSLLRGSVNTPVGRITLRLQDREGRYRLSAESQPQSGGATLVVHPPFQREPLPQEPYIVSAAPDFEPVTTGSLPVTLTVELGRVNLTLARLADLKPGDLIELDRDPSAPVELTSGGRLVARGELVQVDDDELGVRVTSVYL